MSAGIPKYIEVKDAVGNTTAFLSPEADGIKEACIDVTLNEKTLLTFFMPMTSSKWDNLTPECRLVVENKVFSILRSEAIEVVRDDRGRAWGKVMASEIWKLLKKDYATVSNDPMLPDPPDLAVVIISGGSDLSGGLYEVGTADHALYALLDGTEWSYVSVPEYQVEGIHDLEEEKESILDNIMHVQETWGGILVWDSVNMTLSLYDENKWQNYAGFQIRYGKNLKTITRTDNYDIVTRLYPFGENDLDISSVNDGIKYLENHQYTNTVYIGKYINQKIHSADTLKSKATEVLDRISRPRHNYRISMVDLRTISSYSHEQFDAGDIVGIIDDSVAIPGAKARVLRRKHEVFRPWICELEIGDPEDNLFTVFHDTAKITEYVKYEIKENPNIQNLLQGFLDSLDFQLKNFNQENQPEAFGEMQNSLLDSIEEYMEYTTADWNEDGVQYTYVQEYTEEPSVYVGLQGDNVANELDTYSFIMVAEHVTDGGNYVGVKVYPQGSNIPTTFSGKITIHAICKGLVGDDEGNGDEGGS